MATYGAYIAFPGNAREAFDHYCDVFGGELDVRTYDANTLAELPFEPPADAVAHAVLRLPDGSELAGGDAMPGDDYPLRGTAYSMIITVASADEGREMIDALVDGGGEVNMPFEQAPWGSHYGQVFDRFGVMWHVSTQ